MAQDWNFYLANNDAFLTNLGELTNARDKQVDIVLNRPGSARFTISLQDEMASYIQEGTTCVKAVCDDIVRWSGIVWNTDENWGSSTLTVTCVGWLELLNYRVVEDWQEKDARYVETDAAQIAFALLTLANTQKDDSGALIPTKITIGDQPSATQIRSRNYLRWSNIGQSIQELSDIEAGFDYEIDPVTRALDIWYGEIKPPSSLRGKGLNKPDARFSIGWGASNLQDFSKSTDVSTMRNRVVASGRFSSVMSSGQTANQAAYGMFEEQVSLSDVVDAPGQPSILGAYANAEVVVRGKPQITYQLVPFPWTPNGSVPRLFVDYGLGDIVYVTARGGRSPLDNHAVRVFGISIAIDNEGNERISALQTAPS